MNDTLTLASRMRLSDDVLFRDLEGEVVLLNLRTGVYFGLDPVGTRIWHLIGEEQSLQQVLDSLVDEYEVPVAQCAQDLLGLVASMREKGLVEVSDRAAP